MKKWIAGVVATVASEILVFWLTEGIRIDRSSDNYVPSSYPWLLLFIFPSYRFENGRLEERNTILRTIGSNLLLKDRKLFIDLKNPWLIIKRGLEDVTEEKKRLELSTTLSPPEFDPSHHPMSPVCRAERGSNQLAWCLAAKALGQRVRIPHLPESSLPYLVANQDGWA